MTKIKIRERGSTEPSRILELVRYDDTRIIGKDVITGRTYIYAKSMSDIEYLDPPEEEKKSGNSESLNSKYIDDFWYHALTGVNKSIQDFTERVDKLEAEMIAVTHTFKSQLDFSQRATERIEKLELQMKATINAFANLGVPVFPARIGSEPPQPTQNKPEHTCQYSKSMDQPYPRKCTICGKREHPDPTKKEDYLFNYDGVVAAFRSAVEKDRVNGTVYLKESTFIKELLHTPIVQLPPTFTRDEVSDAYERWRSKGYMYKSGLLSELDKVRGSNV